MAIKIQFDSLSHPETPTLVLATRGGKKLGQLNAKQIVVADHLNDASEIQFEVYKYLDGAKDYLWDEIINFRLVWCKEWDVWFEMTVETNEASETEIIKTCSCTRLGQAELSQAYLHNVEINTEDDIARDDYEVTVLYNPDNPSASLLHRMMDEAPHYSIIHVDDTIKDIQRSFSFDDVTIYDAFQDVAEEIGCLFVFNSNSGNDGSIQRTISVYDLETTCLECGYRGEFTDVCPECGSTYINSGYGTDATIFVTSDELANELQFLTDTDSVKNCFLLEAGDDLMTATIKNCNPNGSDHLWYITDESKRDMSDELVEKIEEYDELYDYYTDACEFTEIDSDILTQYNELVEKYSEYNEDLSSVSIPIVGYSALMTAYYDTIDFNLYLQSGLMPSVDMSGTTAEEQAALLTADSISPVAVASISNISLATANSAVLAVAKILVKSGYGVKVANSSLADYVWTGSFTVTNYSDEDDVATSNTISVAISDDYESYISQMISKALSQEDADDVSITGLFSKDYDDFCEELCKYCLDSLTSFYDACQACINILIEQGAADDTAWIETGTNLYESLYTPYYKKLCAIESEMAVRQSEIYTIVGEYDSDGEIVTYGLQTYILQVIANTQAALEFETYLGEDLWLEFCAFRREQKYSNTNFISDGLNNAELISNAMEFISVAEKEIYKSAELQHSISSTLHNLLVIEKFRPLVDYFEVGNWIRVKVDDSIYKLRLIGYEIDYDNLDELSVEFSDVMKLMDGLSDQQAIISQAASMATSYSATQRQASQGSSSSETVSSWIENGLNVTATKIISDESNQSITWDSNGLLFRKYDDVTESFLDTQLRIINSTIAITDDNWQTVRSAIGNYYYTDPETGEIVSTYGINADAIIGKLILGESIGVYNSAGTMKFTEDGLVISNGVNTFTVDPNATNLLSISTSDEDILYVDGNGKLYVSGVVYATSGAIGNWILSENAIYVGTDSMTSKTPGTYIGVDGIRQYASDSSYVNIENGTINAVGVSMTGVVNTVSGTIGGWDVSEESLYHNTTSLTSTEVGTYLGIDGIRQYGSTSAYVNITSGVVTAIGANITGRITATSGSIGNLTIQSGYLYHNSTSLADYSCGISCGSDDGGIDGHMLWCGSTFSVDYSGAMHETGHGDIQDLYYEYITGSADSRLVNDLGNLSQSECLTILEGLTAKRYALEDDDLARPMYGYYGQDVRDLLKSSGIGYRGVLGINKTQSLDDSQKVRGDAVTDLSTDEDSVTYTLDYTQIVPVLTTGWQYHNGLIAELSEQITSLTEQVETLTKQVETLTEQLEALSG